MWSRRLSGRVMFKYETVNVFAKDPAKAKVKMDEEIAARFGARLAHVTPFIKPNGWASAAETVALILTFEIEVTE